MWYTRAHTRRIANGHLEGFVSYIRLRRHVLHLRYGDGAEYGEERVDDVVLAHEDCAEQVRDHDQTELLRVCATLDQRRDEDGHVRDEDHTE